MLLKMRGVLPKTVTDAEGHLGAADTENEAAVEWFEVVKLSGEWPVRQCCRFILRPLWGFEDHADRFLAFSFISCRASECPFRRCESGLLGLEILL